MVAASCLEPRFACPLPPGSCPTCLPWGVSEDGPRLGFQSPDECGRDSKVQLSDEETEVPSPRGYLPSVLYTTRDAAGKGPRSADSQCRDLAHLVHLCNKYVLST